MFAVYVPLTLFAAVIGWNRLPTLLRGEKVTNIDPSLRAAIANGYRWSNALALACGCVAFVIAIRVACAVNPTARSMSALPHNRICNGSSERYEVHGVCRGLPLSPGFATVATVARVAGRDDVLSIVVAVWERRTFRSFGSNEIYELETTSR